MTEIFYPLEKLLPSEVAGDFLVEGIGDDANAPGFRDVYHVDDADGIAPLFSGGDEVEQFVGCALKKVAVEIILTFVGEEGEVEHIHFDEFIEKVGSERNVRHEVVAKGSADDS